MIFTMSSKYTLSIIQWRWHCALFEKKHHQASSDLSFDRLNLKEATITNWPIILKGINLTWEPEEAGVAEDPEEGHQRREAQVLHQRGNDLSLSISSVFGMSRTGVSDVIWFSSRFLSSISRPWKRFMVCKTFLLTDVMWFVRNNLFNKKMRKCGSS